MMCLKAAVEEQREQVFYFGKYSPGLKDLGHFGLKCDMMFHHGEEKEGGLVGGSRKSKPDRNMNVTHGLSALPHINSHVSG